MRNKYGFCYLSLDGCNYIPVNDGNVGKKWLKVQRISKPPKDVINQIQNYIEKAETQRILLE